MTVDRVEDHTLRLIGARKAVTMHCGPWAFDAETGAEVDDELGWGPEYGRTGSFIEPRDNDG